MNQIHPGDLKISLPYSRIKAYGPLLVIHISKRIN